MPYTFALVAIPLIFYSPRSSRGHEELIVLIFFLRAAFDVAQGHDLLHSNPNPSLILAPLKIDTMEIMFM